MEHGVIKSVISFIRYLSNSINLSVVKHETLIIDLNLGDTFHLQIRMNRVKLVPHSPIFHDSLHGRSNGSFLVLSIIESLVNGELELENKNLKQDGLSLESSSYLNVTLR